MNAMATVQRMTADEYLAGPEHPRRSELIDGELIVHQPRKAHQVAVMALQYALERWIRTAPQRGQLWIPLDVKLDEHNVFAPDLLWYRAGRDDAPGPPYPLPDIAVEVRSPSTWRYDIGAKKAAYERAGLPELWLVDTAGDVVLVFRRSSPAAVTFDVALELAVGDALTSPLLPGSAARCATCSMPSAMLRHCTLSLTSMGAGDTAGAARRRGRGVEVVAIDAAAVPCSGFAEGLARLE